MADFIDIVAIQRDDDPITVHVLDDNGDEIAKLDQDIFKRFTSHPIQGWIANDDRFGSGREHVIRIQRDDVEQL